MSSADIQYVVGVKKAKHLRRHILESAKYTIDVLKEKKHVMDVRSQQTQKVAELRETLDDLHNLFGKLKTHIPKKKTPPTLKQEVEKARAREQNPPEPEPAEDMPDPDESDLHEVKGLGPARVQKLHEIGICSAEDLAQTSVSRLSKADISASLAEKLITRAREVLPAPKGKTLSEMDILEQKLSAIESKLNNL